MGIELQRVVEYVTKNTRGLANVDLARLNLRVGKPLSRMAMTLPDDPAVVSSAWQCAREILGEGEETAR